MSAFILRPMAATDLPAVMAVQASCYDAALIETEAALLSRLTLGPDLCWIAEKAAGTDGPVLGGYLLTHAWPADSLPAWNGVLPAGSMEPPGPSELWFVHDMAVAPSAQGCGLARRLYEAARQRAMLRGLAASRLVAVQSAADWWRRQGYAPVPTDALARSVVAKLACYGDDARLMQCALPPAASAAGGSDRMGRAGQPEQPGRDPAS